MHENCYSTLSSVPGDKQQKFTKDGGGGKPTQVGVYAGARMRTGMITSCKGELDMAGAWPPLGGGRGRGREQGMPSAPRGEVGALASTALPSSSLSRTNTILILMSSCQGAGFPSPAFPPAWTLPAQYTDSLPPLHSGLKPPPERGYIYTDRSGSVPVTKDACWTWAQIPLKCVSG